MTLLHSGLLTSELIRATWPAESGSLRYAHLYSGTQGEGPPDRALQGVLTNLVLAFPMPENLYGHVLALRGAAALSEGDWYPRFAYRPYVRAEDPPPPPPLTQRLGSRAAAAARTTVAFLARPAGGTRSLRDEAAVTRQLERMLREIGLRCAHPLPPQPL